ncbi:Hypothetical protein D9617_155g010610 [Elsinoe fawcettii]|nr:Hypothetical protein D9617_155g010610 [Elsinoe fawcettii]
MSERNDHDDSAIIDVDPAILNSFPYGMPASNYGFNSGPSLVNGFDLTNGHEQLAYTSQQYFNSQQPVFTALPNLPTSPSISGRDHVNSAPTTTGIPPAGTEYRAWTAPTQQQLPGHTEQRSGQQTPWDFICDGLERALQYRRERNSRCRLTIRYTQDADGERYTLEAVPAERNSSSNAVSR